VSAPSSDYVVKMFRVGLVSGGYREPGRRPVHAERARCREVPQRESVTSNIPSRREHQNLEPNIRTRNTDIMSLCCIHGRIRRFRRIA
jgi:hypothetical protein